MDQFKVKTKLGGLTFTHAQNRVKVVGAKDALVDWRYKYADVLYGAFGHIFEIDNCSASDVYQVLNTLYGPDRLTVSSLTKEKCKKELRSVPSGFIP